MSAAHSLFGRANGWPGMLLAIGEPLQGQPSLTSPLGTAMKRDLLILSSFGYVVFLIAGLDTGFGVYRTPAYCFAALACAGVAVACASRRLRWFWGVAGVAAVVCSLYGYRQNDQWRERLAHILAQQPPPTATQNHTNK
jgi:hypothetical protein